MNRNKEKPYLEFGGNAFYINLESILDVIKIDTIEKIPQQVQEPIALTKKGKGKNSNKNKEENLELKMDVNPEQMDIIPDQIMGLQVDISKWEILRLMIDAIMSSSSEVDDKLGMAGLNNNTSIPFKIAFNTLLRYNILQEEE